MAKLKVAGYWGSSCGGCEIATLEIGANIVKLAELADIVFWPCIVDSKYKDVEAMKDGEIDLCLYNGAIQNEENEHIAKLLRKKSKVMVAYGSCSYEGCIPGLANVANREEIFDRIFTSCPSVDNPKNIIPQTSYKVPEGELTLPKIYDTVRPLAAVVDVDYFQPGCPPTGEQTWAVLQAVVTGNLPPKGSIVGAGTRALCDECKRNKEEKKVKKFYRTHQIMPDPDRCLLEQGLLCAGLATREGCGALCPSAGMPCTGCYGPPDGVVDQGAKFMSAVASIVDSNDPAEIAAILDDIKDPIGTFYRYSLPSSILRRVQIK
jgi:F420-non-reducing hydrogenase small subunit